MKLISLFTGTGGLDLGFHREDYDIIWANDIVEDFCISYENNFNVKPVCKDINKINLTAIPHGDIVVGGPPCQSFSLLGKRGKDDQRGQLVWSYIKVIDQIRPRVFLFENVPGIRSAKTPSGTKVIDDLKKAFLDIGYSIETYLLNAADYGVPQRRRRVFIIGNSLESEIGIPQATHSKSGGNGLKKWVTSKEALSDLPQPTESGNALYNRKPQYDYQRMIRDGSKKVTYHYQPYSSKKDMAIIQSVTPGGNYMDVPDEIATKRILNFKKTGGRTTTYGRLHPDTTPYTINTHFNRPNVGCNIHYEQDRLITIREALRIQSFPDTFQLHSSNKRNYYIQVGNAVPPLLAQAWAKHIKQTL